MKKTHFQSGERLKNNYPRQTKQKATKQEMKRRVMQKRKKKFKHPRLIEWKEWDDEKEE